MHRPRLRDVLPPLTTAIIAVTLLGQLAWAIAVLTGAAGLRPREVPAAVAADPVVAEALVAQYDDLPSHPFALTPVPDAVAARAAVDDGRARAALVVDMTGRTDRVYLSPESTAGLDAAIRERVTSLESSLGREVRFERLGPADAEERRGAARLAVILTSLVGFLVALGTSLRFGPVARDARRGLRRLVLAGGVAALAGGLLGLALLGPASGVLVGALVAGCATSTTFALESLFGWPGLGLAVGSFGASAAPVVTEVDRYLVSAPLARGALLGIPGAGFEAAAGVTLRGAPEVAPLITLGVWLLTALLVVSVARLVRHRHDVASPATPYGGVAGVRAWRVRVAAIVTPLAVVMLALTTLVPRPQVAAAGARPSLAASTECVSTGPVRDVADLNRIASLRGTGAFRGGDVGADALLQDGRRLWLFGDTLRDGAAGTGYVRNSMLVSDEDCLAAVLPATGGAIVPDREPGPQGVGYWPMSTVVLERAGYDLVYVTTQRVRTTGSGPFDFENLGLGVAVFTVPTGQTPQLIQQRDIGPDGTSRAHPTWGAATALAEEADERWLYVFGTTTPGTDEAWGYSLRVARVHPEELLREDLWRYWDGSGWSTDASRALDVIPARDGVSQTLSVFEQDGRWFALSKRNDLLGSDITVWTAPAPTGPWSAGQAVHRIPQGGTGQLRYMPLAHPTVFPKDGTVVASYSTNNTDSDKILADPRRYRPHFVRVDLPG